MDDLISRQQAINALSTITMYKGSIPFDTAVMRIEQLPSAQQEIVRCKDCDWWTKQEDSLQGRCALLQMYPTGGWFCGNARSNEGKTAFGMAITALELFGNSEQFPSAQPEIIRCRNCKFASGDSRICMKFDHSPIGELDFCSFAERREDG